MRECAGLGRARMREGTGVWYEIGRKFLIAQVERGESRGREPAGERRVSRTFSRGSTRWGNINCRV